MKNLFKLIGIIALVAIIGFSFAACGGDDDGGGGDDGTITIDGWKWYAEDDGFNDGKSTSTMTQGSGNKLTFSGNLIFNQQSNIHGYANLYAIPNSTNLTALKTANSISFKVIGDGKKYLVEVRTSDVTDYCFHKYEFTAPITETTITVQYSELTQESWGMTKTFNKNNITMITFQAASITTVSGPFNITIWDLKVGGSTSSGGDGGNGIGNTITTDAEVVYYSNIQDLTKAKSITNFGFNDRKPLSNFLDGSPSVTVNDGKVTIILGTPKSASFQNNDFPQSVTVNPSSVKTFTVGFTTSDEKYGLYLMKDINNVAFLIYADRNATITGTATEDGVKFTYNISLKTGWNYLYGTNSGSTATGTASTTLPSGFKWTVVERQ